MKKTFDRNNKHTGWEIPGTDIQIHRHIHYPGEWMVNCRSLGISVVVLCNASVTDEAAIARYVMLKIVPIRDRVQKIITEVNQYT